MSDRSEYKSAKLRRDIEAEYRERIETLEKHGRVFDRVIDALPNDTLSSVNLYGGYSSIYASGDAHELAAVIRALRINGFKSDSKPTAKKPSFEACYYHDSGFRIFLHFTSKVCRRVKVGETLVKQDVYEIVCGEMSLPA